MRIIVIVIIAIVVCTASVTQAQDCGSGLPCGPIPWRLPRFPRLASPTPMPTFALTAQATQVSGAVPTPAPLPTNPPLSNVDTTGISDSLSTLNAVIAQTPMAINDINGTPFDTNTAFNELGGNAGQFFGYARTVSTASFGAMSPLVVFSLTALVIVLATKLITFMLPLISAVFGVIRKVISLILDFLPF